MSSWNNPNSNRPPNVSGGNEAYDSEEEGEIGGGNLAPPPPPPHQHPSSDVSHEGGGGSFSDRGGPPPPPIPPPMGGGNLHRRSSWGGPGGGGRGGRGGRGPPLPPFGGMHRSQSLGHGPPPPRGGSGRKSPSLLPPPPPPPPPPPRPTDPRFRNNSGGPRPPLGGGGIDSNAPGGVAPNAPGGINAPGGGGNTNPPSYSSLADEGPLRQRQPSFEGGVPPIPPSDHHFRAMDSGGGGGGGFRRPSSDNFREFIPRGGDNSGGDAMFDAGGPNDGGPPPPFDSAGGFRNDSSGSLPEPLPPPFRGASSGSGDFPPDGPPFRGGFRGGRGGGFFRGRGGRGRGGGGPMSDEGRGGGGGGGSYYGPPEDRFGRSPIRGRFRGRGGGRMLPMGGRGGGGRSMDNIPNSVGSNSSLPPLPPPDDIRSGGHFRSMSHGGGNVPPPPPKDHFGRSWSASGTNSGPSSPNQPPRRMVDTTGISDGNPPAPASLSASSSTGPSHTSAPSSPQPSNNPPLVAAAAAKPAPPEAAAAPVEPPPALDTTALDENQERAEGVIQFLAKLIDDDSLLKGGQDEKSSLLPNKQLLFRAMAKLDVQTKDLQKQLQAKEDELKTANEAQEQAQKDQEVIESDAISQRAESREAARKELEESIKEFQQDKIKQGEADFEKAISRATTELEDEIRQMRDAMEAKLTEEMQGELTAAAAPFEADEKQAQKDVQKVTQAVSKTETRLETVEAVLQKRMAEKSQGSRLSMQDVVSNILAENQRKAAEAHANPFGIYGTAAASTVAAALDPMSLELQELRDPKENKTLAEWADMARQVQGLSSALYSEPSETPYFAQNEEHFRVIEPLVKEYVRDSQTRLDNHFTDLAEEYEYRRRLYKQQRKIQHAGVPEEQWKPASAIIPRQTNMMILESGGARAPTQPPPSNASTSNPYRRARRNNEVRSEYEQEQIIAELAAKEAMEKKIAFGGSALPRQIGTVERKIVPQFINTFNSQKIDVEQLERDLAVSNAWSDMEKCIFLDRFMQHPKDFRKIASFLRNKTTQDCVAYYYDSKKTVPYKFALKEFVMRRKRRGNYHIWDATIQAALASGAVVKAGTSEDKPLVFLLPETDETYVSHGLHPVKLDMLDSMQIDERAAADYIAEHEDDESEDEGFTNKRKADALVEVAPEIRKFLKVETPPPTAGNPKESSRGKDTKETENTKQSAAKALSRSKTPPLPSEQAETEPSSDRLTPLRSKPQKWTSAEKRIFVETLEKHGRKWELLAQAVGTKSIGQIKNFYYDYKKQSGKTAKVKKPPSRSERMKAREGDDGGAVAVAKTGPSEETSLAAATQDDVMTNTEERTAKGAQELVESEERAVSSDEAVGEPAMFPPSFASMLHQEAVSPLPTAPGLSQQHQALVQQQLEMTGAPSLPDMIADSQIQRHHQILQQSQQSSQSVQQQTLPSAHSQRQPSLTGSLPEQSQSLHGVTEQHLRELALAQQIQALQQELAATRSGRDWGAPPAAPPAPPASSLFDRSLSDEAARLLRHHSQSHHQQILSNLLPWVSPSMLGGGGGSSGQAAPSPSSNPISVPSSDRFGSAGLSDFDQQQLRSLLSLQQQQAHQQQQQQQQRQAHQQQHRSPPPSQGLHESLGLSGLVNPSALRLLEQQQQQQQQQRQQQHAEDPRLELLRQLLGGGSGGDAGAPQGSSFHDFLPR